MALITVIVSIFIGVWGLLVAGAATILFLPLLLFLLGIGLLVAAWDIAGNRRVRYVCQTCSTIWTVPLLDKRVVGYSSVRADEISPDQEMLDERSAHLEDSPSPLVVNELILSLQEGDTATRRRAAARLQRLLPALEAMPATKAGAERALAEYERSQ